MRPNAALGPAATAAAALWNEFRNIELFITALTGDVERVCDQEMYHTDRWICLTPSVTVRNEQATPEAETETQACQPGRSTHVAGICSKFVYSNMTMCPNLHTRNLHTRTTSEDDQISCVGGFREVCWSRVVTVNRAQHLRPALAVLLSDPAAVCGAKCAGGSKTGTAT